MLYRCLMSLRPHRMRCQDRLCPCVQCNLPCPRRLHKASLYSVCAQQTSLLQTPPHAHHSLCPTRTPLSPHKSPPGRCTDVNQHISRRPSSTMGLLQVQLST